MKYLQECYSLLHFSAAIVLRSVTWNILTSIIPIELQRSLYRNGCVRVHGAYLDLNVLMNYPSPNLILQERFDYLNFFDSTRYILNSGFGQGNERDLKNILNYNSWTPDRPIANGDS